ncbi:phage portal protein [Blautia sp. MSJ-36]|uniref:phage portal protein n=1 Tax=Blautia sp. MSJ-36 TaxID=2841530 RepID=UPI001C0FB394|nr:phage portal protein [Blautia sp. MSJ-36]MBU5448566.1 phage portal protein [Blautia sp. MSJ-36]
MNIFSYFQKKGIDTVDSSFYRMIALWESWYKGKVRNFTFYRIYSGQGTYSRKQRKSLGMAKKLSEDIADLLLNERVQITLSDETTGNFVEEILKQNRFLVLGNDYQERKAYSGTVAYIPYLYDAEADAEGRILSGTGKIGIDYVSAKDIFPISWSNGRVTECAFTFSKTVNRKKYVQVQIHQLEQTEQGMQYVIENSVLECQSGSREGKELTEEEWKQLKPFRYLSPRIETGTPEPQFVIDRLNIVNNADEDESNPMGIAIYANSIDILKKLDIEYDSYNNEFDLGRKRIFVAPEMVKNADGNPAFDPEDTVFYQMPDNYDKDKEGLIKEINMDLRAEQHSKAIDDDLNYLSLKCGFGTERYKFDSSGVKTATEVISENSDMYRMIKKHEIILEDVLKELVRIIIRLGIVLGNQLDQETEITIDFDDSIIEDKEAERQSDRQDVSMGAMPLWEYRAKYYGETEEKAKAAVRQPEDTVIE